MIWTVSFVCLFNCLVIYLFIYQTFWWNILPESAIVILLKNKCQSLYNYIFFIHFKLESKYFLGHNNWWICCPLNHLWLRWLICQWTNFKRTIKCLWTFRVTMLWIIITFFPEGISTILLIISEAMTVIWIGDEHSCYSAILWEAQASLKLENSVLVRLSFNSQLSVLFLTS